MAIFIQAIAFAQTFPIDIAFLFAGDTLYLEFLVAIRAGGMHLQEFLRFALRLIQLAPGSMRKNAVMKAR
jgi:hypothetical protein